MEGSPDDPQEDLNDGHDASGDSSDASKEDTITNGRAENASNAETEHGDPDGSQANPPPDNPAAPAAPQGATTPQNFLIDEEYNKALMIPVPQKGSYPAALLLTGSIVPLPFIVIIITATVYITGLIPQFLGLANLPVILVSLGVTLLLWLLISIPFRSFATFDNANPHSSSHLKRHLLTLRSSLTVLKRNFDPTSSQTDAKESSLVSFRNKSPEDYDLVLKNVPECLAAANNQLGSRGLSWTMGVGYLKAWNFVHRAKEAMFDIAPREFVIREALHDESAIDGSSIASRDYLLSNVKTAVKTLSPSAAVYLKSLPVQDRNAPPGNPPDQQKLLEPLDPLVETEARNALRDARQTLDEFRATIWDGLVRLRNLLVGTTLGTGLLTYILLCVTITVGVRVESMKAAIIFYLVGAIVGLFSRLYTESQSDSAIDDYGLTIARIAVIPIISGLAAVAGVLVVSVLSLNLLGAPGANHTTNVLPRLQDIYDLVQNQQGIILAALFGLTPNLLINILKQKADNAKTQLKNSSAPNQGN